MGNNGIHTAEQVITLHGEGKLHSTMLDKMGLSWERFDELYKAVLPLCTTPPMFGEQLLERLVSKDELHNTGSSGLDALLGGGVGTGQLTELVGKTSTFKTQICHQIAVIAALKQSSVLYLDTNNAFSPRRLADVLFAIEPSLESQRQADEVPPQLGCLLTNVRMQPVYTAEALLQALRSAQERMRTDVWSSTTPMATSELPGSLESSDEESVFWAQLRVVIVDSMASLILPILGRSATGHALLMHIVQLLRELATTHNLAVVTTNFLVQGDQDGPMAVRPALGATWAYVPSWSVLLSVDEDSHTGSAPDKGRMLRMNAELIKSPTQPLHRPVTCMLLG
uniref:RecA family profile 1 domain-containing protein n=1 Tax=Eutreptiella gymnastica TaxID=73025 RepID=A0A7S1NA12_9EUGL